MATIEIDIDKIKARKGELETELRNITGLLQMAEQFAKPYVAVPPPQAPPLVTVPVAHTNGDSIPRRGFTPGLRRAVILALHTGPATEKDLAKALGWDFSRTRIVVQSMIKFRIAFLNEHGRIQITDEGSKQAAWYLANPQYLCYRPGK